MDIISDKLNTSGRCALTHNKCVGYLLVCSVSCLLEIYVAQGALVFGCREIQMRQQHTGAAKI
ncbi:MAG: hypothetical protein ACI80S_000052 [Pseudohongiellaceae bacterium]|jgi:hypothetical protein